MLSKRNSSSKPGAPGSLSRRDFTFKSLAAGAIQQLFRGGPLGIIGAASAAAALPVIARVDDVPVSAYPVKNTSEDGRAVPARPPGLPNSMFKGRWVALRTSDIQMYFDSMFGGVAGHVVVNGVGMIEPYVGAGNNFVYDSGNDPTEGGTGFLARPIARLDNNESRMFTYYASEEVCQDNVYRRRLCPPMFWQSQDAADDSIAPYPNDPNGGWATKYAPKDLPAATFAPPEMAVVFKPGPGIGVGMFFVGNAMTPAGAWNSRICRFPEARVAFSVKIDLSMGDPGAWGGVMWGKAVPETAVANISDAYSASGYHFSVNKGGSLDLQRTAPGGAQTSLWKGRVPVPRADSQYTLEMRTNNSLPGRFELFVDAIQVATVLDSKPLTGPHVGLVAGATTNALVRFSNRSIYDLGFELINQFTALPDGSIEQDAVLRLAPGVTSPRPLYRAGITPYTNHFATIPGTNQQRITAAWILDAYGRRLENPFQSHWPVLGTAEQPYTVYVGDPDGDTGIYLTPVRMEVNGSAAARPHMLLSKVGQDRSFNLVPAFNPMPHEANSAPQLISSVRVVINWGRRHPALPLGTPGLTLDTISASPGTTATLRARFIRTMQVPVAQKKIRFAVNGREVGEAITDAGGVASITYPVGPGEKPNTDYQLKAQFAGDEGNNPAGASATLHIVAPPPVATKTSVANATARRGSTVALQASVKTSAGANIGSAPIAFYVDGKMVSTVFQTAAGVATLTIVLSKTMATGAHELKAVFPGSASFSPSTGLAVLIVT